MVPQLLKWIRLTHLLWWNRRAIVIFVASAIVIGSVAFASLTGGRSQGDSGHRLEVGRDHHRQQTAVIAGQPIIPLAGKDWLLDNGRAHVTATIWQGGDPAQTTFILMPHGLNAKFTECKYTAADKVEVPGKGVGTILEEGKRVVFQDGSFFVRRVKMDDIDLTAYWKVSGDPSQIILFAHTQDQGYVRAIDGKESPVVFGDYHRFSIPELGLEGAVDDGGQTLVIVPINQNPVRSTPGHVVWYRSPVKPRLNPSVPVK